MTDHQLCLNHGGIMTSQARHTCPALTNEARSDCRVCNGRFPRCVETCRVLNHAMSTLMTRAQDPTQSLAQCDFAFKSKCEAAKTPDRMAEEEAHKWDPQTLLK